MEICHYNFHNLEICHVCHWHVGATPHSLMCGSTRHISIWQNHNGMVQISLVYTSVLCICSMITGYRGCTSVCASQVNSANLLYIHKCPVRLAYQPPVLFSQNKSTISNNHQPTEKGWKNVATGSFKDEAYGQLQSSLKWRRINDKKKTEAGIHRQKGFFFWK
jgi:hypothetical protein